LQFFNILSMYCTLLYCGKPIRQIGSIQNAFLVSIFHLLNCEFICCSSLRRRKRNRKYVVCRQVYNINCRKYFRILIFLLSSIVDSMESHGSVVTHLLSQVKIGMDLTRVALPTFILERRSLLEMYADYFAHPDQFVRYF